jgi:hypothetical protein
MISDETTSPFAAESSEEGRKEILMTTKQKRGRFHFLKIFATAALLAAALLGSSACSVLQVNSQWRAKDIVINGLPDEWKDSLVPVKDDGFSFGIRNDDRFLYVCIVGDTPMLMSMAVSRGMTVWLDPAGGKSKVFGIKFPLGPTAAAPQNAPPATGAGGRPAPPINEVIILGPEKDALKQIAIKDLKGLEIRAAVVKGVFAYEIKVPFVATPEFPYALGSAPGPFVGIGIEIPGMRRGGGGGGMGGGGGEGIDDVGGMGMGGGSGMSEGGGGGGSEGGGGGGGGMRGGGMGGGGRSGMTGLNFWAKVTLAKS